MYTKNDVIFIFYKVCDFHMLFLPSRGIKNGYVNYIIEKGLKSEIKIFTSSNYIDSNGERDPFLSLGFSDKNWASVDRLNQWIQYNLPGYINIKNYSIKSINNLDMFALKGWKLTASHNNHTQYDVLDSIDYTEELMGDLISTRSVKNNNDRIY